MAETVPLPILRTNYSAFSDAADTAAARHGYPCKPGCSACCSDPVPVTDGDLVLVRDAVAALAPSVREAVDKRAIEYALAFAAALERNAPEGSPPVDPIAAYDGVCGAVKKTVIGAGSVAGYAANVTSAASMRALFGGAGHACPLLEGNMCLVYSSRPLACRAHFAFGPDACKAGPGPGNGFARNAVMKAVKGMTLRSVGVLGMELARDAANRGRLD